MPAVKRQPHSRQLVPVSSTPVTRPGSRRCHAKPAQRTGTCIWPVDLPLEPVLRSGDSAGTLIPLNAGLTATMTVSDSHRHRSSRRLQHSSDFASGPRHGASRTKPRRSQVRAKDFHACKRSVKTARGARRPGSGITRPAMLPSTRAQAHRHPEHEGPFRCTSACPHEPLPGTPRLVSREDRRTARGDTWLVTRFVPVDSAPPA